MRSQSISSSVSKTSGSRLVISAEITAPSSTLQCFDIMVLKTRKGNPFTAHFFVEAKKIKFST